jgi:hypothetical protein
VDKEATEAAFALVMGLALSNKTSVAGQLFLFRAAYHLSPALCAKVKFEKTH